MKTYRMGIIGYGGMGSYHHRTIAITDRLAVVGAYDINIERMKVAEKAGLKAYNSQDEILDDKSIDIILVATPNNFHHDIACEAMKKGKHVIVEKPVAMSSDELISMTETAKECGVIFTIHQNRRMDRDFKMVREVVEKGMIGKPFSIESRVFGSKGIPTGWRCHKLAGGGMLLDWGVHLIDQMMVMIPEKIVSVYANLLSVRFPEVDDYCRVIIKFEGGTMVSVEVGTANYYNLPRWYVCGENGTFVIKDWDNSNILVRVKEAGMIWEDEILYTKAGPTKTMAPRTKDSVEELVIAEPSTDYTKTYSNLINVIEGTEQLLVKPEEALRVMRVLEACFESQETGNTVTAII